MNNRYILEPYKGPSSRVRCPGCGKPREFARYLDTETGDLLPDHVGRCNRESSCGYHYTPKQYFEATRPIGGSSYCPPARSKPKPEPVKPVQCLPLQLVSQTMAGYERNNFVLFLKSLFGQSLTNDLVARYFIGTSKHWQGATIFWQIDAQEFARQAKVMLYNPATGKRVKNGQEAMKWNARDAKCMPDVDNGDKIYFAGKGLLNDYEANLIQCLFGEHLLTENPQARVAIVESEKTAVVASVYFPDMVWLATGGKNGARWTDPAVCKALTGRDIILFPDLNEFDIWSQKAQEVKKAVTCKISVSNLLESIATDEQRAGGLDLADFLLVRDDTSGWALTDLGYPVFIDVQK